MEVGVSQETHGLKERSISESSHNRATAWLCADLQQQRETKKSDSGRARSRARGVSLVTISTALRHKHTFHELTATASAGEPWPRRSYSMRAAV